MSLARASTLCAFCPKLCRFACPVAEAEAREAVTPWGKMSLVYLATQLETLDVEEDARDLALEACTSCGACASSCAHGNPVGETLAAARAELSTARSQDIARNFAQSGDARGREFDDVYDAFAGRTRGTIAYFPGCARATDGKDAVAMDLAALERALGFAVPLVELPRGSRCCGYPAKVEGQVHEADAARERLAQACADFQTIVTPDPGCVDTMGAPFVPLVEVLAKNKDKFAGAAPKERVRYHDPCYLGRKRGTYEPPRELIRAATGSAPLEFSSSCKDADCSGAGGLYPTSNPEGSRAVAVRRLEDKTGDALVVTACPSARRNFARAGGARHWHRGVAHGRRRMSVVFLLNPRAGNGAARRKFERYRGTAESLLGAIDVRFTERQDHATELTRAAIAGGAQTVVAVGGDGTINEVVNGFYDDQGTVIDDGANLGIISLGTGSDLRRTLGFENADGKDSIKKDIERIARGESRRVDLGRCTFTTPAGEEESRLFVNIGSFGVTGAIVEKANHGSKALGAKLSYLKATVSTLVSSKPMRADIFLDDDKCACSGEDLAFVVVANGRYFGGSMKVAPDAEMDDGQFDIVIAQGRGLGFFARHGRSIYSGEHVKLKEVQVERCAKVRAIPTSSDAILVELDGEQPGALPALFEIVTAAINVLV